MFEVGSFSVGVFEGVFAGLIVALITLVCGWLYSTRFRTLLFRAINWLFDTKIHAVLTRVDRYDTAPSKELDMEIFREIQEISSSVTFDALSNNVLRIKGDSLPSPLEIRIEEESAIDEYPSESPRFEVRVRTYPSMSFGYRTDSSLKEFEVLSERIALSLNQECFDGRQPLLTFIEGEITDHVQKERGVVEVPSLDMRAKVHENGVRLTIEDPRYLKEGIRKFIRPSYRA